MADQVVDGVAVQVTGSVQPLEQSMQQAATSVQQGTQKMSVALENLAISSGNARVKIGESLEEVSVVTERAANKLEHIGISGAFVFNSLAEGGERGVTRLGHAIAGFGFVFGPVVGAISIAAAIAFERIVEFFHKTEEEAKKFREALAAELGKLANAGESTKLQEKMKEVFYGTPFDEKGALVKSSKYAIGAFEGSLADLEAHFDDLNRQLPKGATMASGAIVTEYNKVVQQLDIMRARAAQVREAITNLQSQPASKTGLLPTVTTADSDKKIAADAKKAYDEATKFLEKYDNDVVNEIQRAWDERVKIGHEGDVKILEAAKQLHDNYLKESAGIFDNIEKDLDKIEKKNAETNKKMAEDGKKFLEQSQQQWMSLFSTIENAWTSTVQKINSGGDSLKNFWKDIFHEMVAAGERAAIQMILQHAAVAAAATWASLSAIPFVGPFIAPAAALATLAAVVALAGGFRSAAGGFDVPAGLNPMTQLHAQEMVLPKEYANVIRGMAGGGGAGGNVTVVIKALDSADVHRWAKANQTTLASAAMNGAKNGASTRSAAGRRGGV